MLLHNFIVDARNEEIDREYFEDFHIDMDSVQAELTERTGEMPRPLVSDNNEAPVGGWPLASYLEMQAKGKEIQKRLTMKLAAGGMQRPMQHGMRYNQHGHVYFDA